MAAVVAAEEVMMVDPLNGEVADIQLAVDALLMAAARKNMINDTVAKLANPMSIRAVKLNYKILFMVEDLLSVFKLDGLALVPSNLDDMKDLAAAAVLILEEIVRLLQRDSEVQQVVKDSHLGWTSFHS